MEVHNIQQLREVLNRVTFAPGCINLNWQWNIETIYNVDGWVKGWLITTGFGQQYIKLGSTVPEVIKICWLGFNYVK